jgi:hypothetical protein
MQFQIRSGSPFRLPSRLFACAALLAVSAVAVAQEKAPKEAQEKPSPEAQAAKANEDPAVTAARRQVQMLDALYKNAVVSITERYQRGQPAIMVAKDVFEAMHKGKYHSARLVDATGSPLGETSEPATPFEKKAAKAMQDGKDYLEEIVGEGKERKFLAATRVPAVHKRCAECHSVEEGDLLGFIRYELPLDE